MEASVTGHEAPPPYSEAIADTEFLPEGFYGSSGSSRLSAYNSESVTLRRNAEALSPPAPGQRLTFYDFLPSPDTCCDSTSSAKDTFSSLLARANYWLRSYPQWRVKNCETIKVWFDVKTKEYQTEVYYDDEKKECVTALGIRLWLTTAEHDFGVSLVQPDLGVVHMVAMSAPIINRAGKTVLAFENVQQLLQRFKRKWENEPLPGRLLCVDTCKTSVHNLQSFDPEIVVFHREKHYSASTLEVVRIFYENGPPENEEIEIVDFLPITTIPMLGSIQREPFKDVFNTARTWLKKHCWDARHRLLNIQTLELDVRPGGRSDTARLWSTAEAKKEFYVRFLRASYVSSSNKAAEEQHDPELTSSIPFAMTFVPVPVPGSTPSKLKFELLHKSRERLEAWVKATGAQVMSVETVWLRSAQSEDVQKTSESSATAVSGSRYRWVSAVRLYLHKEYADPPAAMLPAMPKMNGHCSIS